LDNFGGIYNQLRPHRALQGATPAHAYSATVKAAPLDHGATPHYRVRNDHVDRLGKISLRRAGRVHHLGVGAAHTGQAVTILIDADTATSSTKTPAKSSAKTPSTPTAATGATNTNHPADGHTQI
jgi:hypothetical protein